MNQLLRSSRAASPPSSFAASPVDDQPFAGWMIKQSTLPAGQSYERHGLLMERLARAQEDHDCGAPIIALHVDRCAIQMRR
jgi:hypothetical protein